MSLGKVIRKYRKIRNLTQEEMAVRLSGNEQTEQTEDPVELTQIQVRVNGQDILFVYGAGTVLIIFSVTAAGIPVLRLKPKEILTKMN